MSGQGIRVAVIDDQPLFRRGVVATFESDPNFEVVVEGVSGALALDGVLREAPDLAVIDGALPEDVRTPLLRELARNGGQTNLLILAPADDPEATESTLASGVGGYLTRNADETELCSAAALVAQGSTVISEAVQVSLSEALERTAAHGRGPLSPREQQVLGLVAQGSSVEDVGRKLFISHSAAKSYLSRTFDKLGVRTQASAVAEAMGQGLIVYRDDSDVAPA